MMTERECDLSEDINPVSLPQLRKDLAHVRTILASARNSKEFMIELQKERIEDADKDSLSIARDKELIEDRKKEYAEKVIDEGDLKGQVRGLTSELNRLHNEAARLREEIREVKGECPGSGDGNPWQVGVPYGGRRYPRPRERGDEDEAMPSRREWGDRGERRARDRNKDSSGYGYGRQQMW